MKENLSRLRFEHVRIWIAVAYSIPLGFVVNFGLGMAFGPALGWLPGAFVGWDLFGLVYIWLTLRVFRGASNNRLRELVPNRQVSIWTKILAGGQDGPGFSVQFAAYALAAAALLPRLKTLAPQGQVAILLGGLLVAAVILSLVIVALSYTVHYARLDFQQPGLTFPGADPPGFTDYLYFAISVTITFGTTDVEVTSTRLRRAVNGHSVLAFAFNGVIIALLVAALA